MVMYDVLSNITTNKHGMKIHVSTRVYSTCVLPKVRPKESIEGTL
jgi:hypothetical protein